MYNLGRNDAGLAAAELALAIEKHVLESGSIDTVGTVGKSCSCIPEIIFWYLLSVEINLEAQ